MKSIIGDFLSHVNRIVTVLEKLPYKKRFEVPFSIPPGLVASADSDEIGME